MRSFRVLLLPSQGGYSQVATEQMMIRPAIGTIIYSGVYYLTFVVLPNNNLVCYIGVRKFYWEVDWEVGQLKNITIKLTFILIIIN